MAYLLRGCVPDDILYYHIIPFTYLPQPTQLQKDLRTYVFTYEEITAFYRDRWAIGGFLGSFLDGLPDVMLFDVMEYYGKYILEAPGFAALPTYPQCPAGGSEVAPLLRKLLAYEPAHATRLLWGKMTPVDRLKFMIAKMGRPS